MECLCLFLMKLLCEARLGGGRGVEASLPRSQGSAASCPHPEPRPRGRRSEPPFRGCRGGSTLCTAPPWLLPAARLGYRPALTKDPQLEGVKTASTFVVDQPRCVFQNYSNAVIWLVVALNQGEWEQPRAGGVQGFLYPPPNPSSPSSPSLQPHPPSTTPPGRGHPRLHSSASLTPCVPT